MTSRKPKSNNPNDYDLTPTSYVPSYFYNSGSDTLICEEDLLYRPKSKVRYRTPQEDILYERALATAQYILDTKATVREASIHFGVSKSTIHRDVTVVLKRYNKPLYRQVKEVFKYNKSMRHIRGGQSTKEKYKALKRAKQATVNSNVNTLNKNTTDVVN